MPKQLFLLGIVFSSLTSIAQSGAGSHSWAGSLHLSTSVSLPFQFTVETSKKEAEYVISIHNGEETIVLTPNKTNSDSLDYVFPNFNSFIRLRPDSASSMEGVWYNKAKENYSIPFSASVVSENPTLTTKTANFEGRWATIFAKGTENEEPAIGLFKQKGDVLTGTFLTETGDYRYLAGKVVADSFELSCFDGSHAFLFRGKLSNDTVQGLFFSGTHWKSNWIAYKDTNFKLRNPESISYMKKESVFTFDLPDLHQQNYHFPNENTKNKVVIIQIMGTWCPNCMDETLFFKELYQKYHEKGLEIISVGYELPKTTEGKIAAIQRLQTRQQLDFTFLVGGERNHDFSMLNAVNAYPTSIIIDKNGNVRSVYTGFYGPGTGSYYTEYSQKTERFIQELLGEKP